MYYKLKLRSYGITRFYFCFYFILKRLFTLVRFSASTDGHHSKISYEKTSDFSFHFGFVFPSYV